VLALRQPGETNEDDIAANKFFIPKTSTLSFSLNGLTIADGGVADKPFCWHE